MTVATQCIMLVNSDGNRVARGVTGRRPSDWNGFRNGGDVARDRHVSGVIVCLTLWRRRPAY